MFATIRKPKPTQETNDEQDNTASPQTRDGHKCPWTCPSCRAKNGYRNLKCYVCDKPSQTTKMMVKERMQNSTSKHQGPANEREVRAQWWDSIVAQGRDPTNPTAADIEESTEVAKTVAKQRTQSSGPKHQGPGPELPAVLREVRGQWWDEIVAQGRDPSNPTAADMQELGRRTAEAVKANSRAKCPPTEEMQAKEQKLSAQVPAKTMSWARGKP